MAGEPTLSSAAPVPAPPAGGRERDRRGAARTIAIEAGLALASFVVALAVGVVGASRTSPAPGELPRLRSVETMATFIERAVESPASGLTRQALDRAFGASKGVGHLPASFGGYLHASIGPGVARVFGELVEVRLGFVLSAALVVPLTYLLARTSLRRRPALLAAASLLLVPRVAHHVAIGAPEAIAAAAWLIVLVPYVASLRRRSPWLFVATGVAFGVALSMSLAASWLPLLVPVHFLVARFSTTRRLAKAGQMPLPSALLAMLVLGPAALLALSPWLWHETLPRLRDLVVASLAPSIAPTLYRGVTIASSPVPRSFALELVVVALPATTLALATVGGSVLASRARRRRDRAGVGPLVVVGLAFALVVPAIAPDMLLEFPPRIELALPFVAIAAGVGLDRSIALVARLAPRSAAWLAPAAGVLLLAPSAFAALRDPATTSAAFSALGGGARRVAATALFATNDGTALRTIAAAIDRLGGSGVTLYSPDVPADVWEAMHAFGLLARPVRVVSQLAGAELVVVTATPAGDGALHALRSNDPSCRPLATVARDGVELAGLYRAR